MRALLFSVIALFASAAQAQNIFQMNAAYQNQINQAQQSAAWPAYAPGYYATPYYSYAPRYAPRYATPIRSYSSNRHLRSLERSYQRSDMETDRFLNQLEMRRQTRALRDIDNTLQNMQINQMFDD